MSPDTKVIVRIDTTNLRPPDPNFFAVRDIGEPHHSAFTTAFDTQ
jgi:hypothetical protein